MNSTTNYRDNGAIGALLDEYEKALFELIALVRPLSKHQICHIVDSDTDDEDCRSIQTILRHVVRAGYGYATYIRNHMGENIEFSNYSLHNTSGAFIEELQAMFQFTEDVFDAYPNIKLEEQDPEQKILVRWGQLYDVEQLMEHAIVHILRHRRQIQRFLLRI